METGEPEGEGARSEKTVDTEAEAEASVAVESMDQVLCIGAGTREERGGSLRGQE